ncbi:hypothetical protein TNCT_455921 [Trichonephila clavata]|uniref:Uncharacterized protein n=1 Tax=Trichonephila clavata TaxID=2740835 RepID=A0A8X6LUG8_TRICU|nr:hypothetical protein TNCT_455921 [Trichonephila clavata]
MPQKRKKSEKLFSSEKPVRRHRFITARSTHLCAERETVGGDEYGNAHFSFPSAVIIALERRHRFAIRPISTFVLRGRFSHKMKDTTSL